MLLQILIFISSLLAIDFEFNRSTEIIVEVKPPITQAAGEMSGTLNVTLSSDSSKTTKITLPFTVLKSNEIVEEEPEKEEESLLPGPSIVSVILMITLLSKLRRRK